MKEDIRKKIRVEGLDDCADLCGGMKGRDGGWRVEAAGCLVVLCVAVCICMASQ